MSTNPKMEFKINCSPDLTMSEITKRLFNRNFHSDVQFSVEGKIIYAHSLELIKRSVVFEQQLEDTMGETTLIPVIDCNYDNFLEFMRYVYTDECTINEDNFIDILKLAAKYKFIKLENQVLNLGKYTAKWCMKLYEHCVRDKYEIASRFIAHISALNFNFYLANNQFVLLHPDAVDELLKFTHVTKGVTEVQIFTAVARWIASYCEIQEITLREGRQRWDKLIRKIRFPTMSNEELRKCYKQKPGLLSDNDKTSIARQIVFGDDESEKELWISKSREEYISPIELRTFQHDGVFNDGELATKFSVSKDTLLHGLRIGIEYNKKPIEIEISESDDKTSASHNIIFVENAPVQHNHLIISLGESIRVKPNFKYSISIKYLETKGEIKVYCRKQTTNLIINDPGKTVTIIQASDNMIEMFFTPATD